MNVNTDVSAVGVLDKKITELGHALAALAAKVESVMALTAAKRRDPAHAGKSLEDFFFEVASPIAQASADTLGDTRDAAGAIEGCKVGDYVTTLDPAVVAGQIARLVSEAKNRVSVTLEKLVGELDIAMRNRQANAAFGILTNPRAATEPCLSLYHGNKVVVCIPGFGTPDCDPEIAAVFVRAGYQLARCLAVSRAIANLPKTTELDLTVLQASCEELNAVGKRFSILSAAHTRVRSAIGNAEQTASEIRAALLAAVEKFVTVVGAEIDRPAKEAENS